MSEAGKFGPKPNQADLPVFGIAYRAALLPFVQIEELARFAWIPLLGDLAVDLISWICAQNGMTMNQERVMTGIADLFVFAPLAVAWCRLAILGPQSVSRRPPFNYGRVELQYLVAAGLMKAGGFVIIGIPMIWGQEAMTIFFAEHNAGPIALAGIVLIAALFVAAILGIRIALLIPSVAVQRYAGIQVTWNQTRGYFERLLAAFVLAVVPFGFVHGLIMGLEKKIDSSFATVIFEIVGSAWSIVLFAVQLTVLCFAYKILVFDKPKADAPTSQPIAVAD